MLNPALVNDYDPVFDRLAGRLRAVEGALARLNEARVARGQWEELVLRSFADASEQLAALTARLHPTASHEFRYIAEVLDMQLTVPPMHHEVGSAHDAHGREVAVAGKENTAAQLGNHRHPLQTDAPLAANGYGTTGGDAVGAVAHGHAVRPQMFPSAPQHADPAPAVAHTGTHSNGFCPADLTSRLCTAPPGGHGLSEAQLAAAVRNLAPAELRNHPPAFFQTLLPVVMPWLSQPRDAAHAFALLHEGFCQHEQIAGTFQAQIAGNAIADAFLSARGRVHAEQCGIRLDKVKELISFLRAAASAGRHPPG
jgi:hypothetical protein